MTLVDALLWALGAFTLGALIVAGAIGIWGEHPHRGQRHTRDRKF